MRIEAEDDRVFVVVEGEVGDAGHGFAPEQVEAEACSFLFVECRFEAGAQLLHALCVFGLAGAADVQDIELGMPFADGGEHPGDGGQRFGGEIGGEEDFFELELRTCGGRAGADDEYGTADGVEDLLSGRAEEEPRNAAAAVGADDEHIDVVLLDEVANDVGDFAFFDPAAELDALEFVGPGEAGQVLIAVAASSFFGGGDHLGEVGKF